MENELMTIYVPFLKEGKIVFRPVMAQQVGSRDFRIISENPDPEGENWEFKTGDVVWCWICELLYPTYQEYIIAIKEAEEEIKEYKTLRGFIKGEEDEEEICVDYSASLRIFGDDLDLDEVSNKLQLEPSLHYRKGDKRNILSRPWRTSMWSYKAPLSESEPLHKHIDTLWSQIKPHKEYLLSLKQKYEVDIFLGYSSNCDHAGLEVPHTSLEMFIELEIPFGLSIIVC